MPTVTQSYGNITTGKEYPVLALGDGYFIKLSPMSLNNYLDVVDVPFRANAFPDFIIASQEGALTIQGMLTILNIPVAVVPLLIEPIPLDDDVIGAVFLVTVDAPHPELISLVGRIPIIEEGYDINTTYILIHGGD